MESSYLCRSWVYHDATPKHFFDRPPDIDRETIPWWRRMDLCTEGKASCSIQASRHPFFGRSNLPPPTLSTEHWRHNTFSDASASPRDSHVPLRMPPLVCRPVAAHSLLALCRLPSPAFQTSHLQAYGLPSQAVESSVWTQCSGSPWTWHSCPMEVNMCPTISTDFLKKTSQVIQDQLVVSLHLTIGTWSIRSRSGFTRFQQSAESFEHFTVKIPPLIHVNAPWNAKPHHIALKKCLSYWFSILYCQWHHLQPTSKLIYNHENILVALKTFTKGPQHVQMHPISRLPCLKVLQWSMWTPWSLIHTTFATCGNVDVNICCHSIPVSALVDSFLGLLMTLMSSNLCIMKELNNRFPHWFWNDQQFWLLKSIMPFIEQNPVFQSQMIMAQPEVFSAGTL